MRDPERIPKILAKLQKAWSEYPDLRLGQLIYNLAGDIESVFYIDDDRLDKRIDEWMEV